jgi:aryl carrier-like protein
MRFSIAVVAVMLLLTACQTSDVPTMSKVPADETENAILSVIHDLFQAMEARDSTRIGFTLHPEAMFVGVNVQGDVLTTRRVEGADFIREVGQPGPPYLERLKNPVVQHSQDFAQVWSEYEFWVGDSLSHCGHDSFQLIRIEEKWRILGVTYSWKPCE